MTILEFECNDYVHMSLRNIKNVKIKPIHKLQMILGSNGSGKTALIREMSPLLSRKDDYGPEGYKIVKYQRGDDVYEFICDFRGAKNLYRITKNDEVICSGHSSTVYQGHVHSLLNLTPEIHKIRIGDIRFTGMDKAFRRALFTKLCPEDYTYAIGYFKRLTKSTRDISGAIERTNSKLMQEKAKLITPEEEKQMREQIARLRRQRDEMLQMWKPTQVTVDQSLDKVQEIDGKINAIVDDFDKSIQIFCNARGYNTQDEVWAEVAQLQGHLLQANAKVEELCESIEKSREIIEQTRIAHSQSAQSINQDYADVSRRLLTLSLRLKNKEWLQDPESAKTTINELFPDLAKLFPEIVEDKELIYLPEKIEQANIRLAALDRELSNLDNLLRDASSNVQAMEHRKDINHIECPKCAHAWIKDFDQDAYDTAVDKVRKLSEAIKKRSGERDSLCSYLEVASHQNSLYGCFSMYARTSPALMPLWKFYNDNRWLRTNASSAMHILDEARSDIETACAIKADEKLKAELELKKKVLDEASNVNTEALAESVAVQEALLHKEMQKARSYSLQVDGLKRALQAMDLQEKAKSNLESLITERDDVIFRAEEANHQTVINAMMSSIDAEIAERERMISQIDSQKALIETLEADVAVYTAKEKLMKKAITALSPSGGIIARGLIGFINHFIAQMNAVIEKVWLYPLVISPITDISDDVELTYDFPYTVDGKKAGQDVSSGSGAQKEIFDLAFMLVYLVHLGLDDSEVFLDEFSIKMDYAHRKEALRMVSDLIKTSSFSQVYMISHYESTYAGVTDADITVLCPENIALPDGVSVNRQTTVTH